MDGGATVMLDWSSATPPSLSRRASAGTLAPVARTAVSPAEPQPLQPRRGIGAVDLEFMLDCVADAMLVIDARARVLHANRAARELLGEVRDVSRGCGALQFRDATTQRAFERVLPRGGDGDTPGRLRVAGSPPAGTTDPGIEDTPPRQFLVRNACGAIVARANVEPLQRNVRHDDAEAGIRLVSMQRLPTPHAVSTDSLCELYGLTVREARVAATTLAAHSIDALALHLGLSRNTVKTHLKRVFRKCEVASLAQLAALVATGPRLR